MLLTRLSATVLLIGILFTGFNIANLHAQIRIKTPKIYIGSTTGYDSNIFRVASSSDSNTVNSSLFAMESKLYSWIRWNKSIKTFISLKGNYDYYFSNSNAKNWEIQASLNSTAILYKNSASWLKGILLDFDIKYGLVDQLYADRELGEETYINLGPTNEYHLSYGDLFDHSEFSLISGLDFAVSNQFSILIGMHYDKSDYKDIKFDQYNYLYALDNDNIGILGKIEYVPAKILEFSIEGEQAFCDYKYKTARDLQRIEYVDKKREYKYSQFKISTRGNFNPLILEFIYRIKNRDDQFEGHYNYKSNGVSGKFIYQINPKFDINLLYSVSHKDYDHLTFGGERLSNTYQYIKIGLNLALTKNLLLNPNFQYNDEESTYYKFNYSRNRLMLNMQYRIY